MKMSLKYILAVSSFGVILNFGGTMTSNAQNGAPAFDCSPSKRGSMSNMEETFCAGQDFNAADRELNRVYRLVISENQSQANLIRQAQRAWLAYRDADCNAVGAGWGNGSGRPMAVSICKTELTNERAKRLRVYYLGER